MRFLVPLILVLVMLVLITTGCAPPAGLQSGDAPAQSDSHPVPFHGDAASSTAASDSAAHDKNGKPETSIPFHDAQSRDSQNLIPQNIPAGTLLTVRLKNSIATGKPDSIAGFDAVVDQAVVIESNQLIPSGTTVSGLVESARASDLKLDHGYLRLTLESIHIAGADVPVQTASLFVRASAAQGQEPQAQLSANEPSSRILRLERGQRLVFRLTKPVALAARQRLSSGF